MTFLAKLDRGSEHLDAIRRTISAWREDEPYEVFLEPQPGSKIHRVKAKRRVTFSTEALSLVIGDCIHNFRSALDHLVFQLGRAAKPALTEREQSHLEFPIFGERPPKREEIDKKIGVLDSRAQATILALQPHRRGSSYKSDPLWLLHELERQDKHRTLQVVTVVRTGFGLGGGNFSLGETQITAGGVPIENEADLGFVTILEPPNSNREADVRFTLSVDIAFTEESPAEGALVTSTLLSFRRYIDAQVLPLLMPFL